MVLVHYLSGRYTASDISLRQIRIPQQLPDRVGLAQVEPVMVMGVAIHNRRLSRLPAWC